MNHFGIFAHGESFDPDVFLAATTIWVDEVWHRGDKGHGHPRSNGVRKVLGDGSTTPLYEQERIAIDYIAANRDGLKALAQAPGVTTFILGLQCHIVLDESTVGFCMRPSAGLMSRALDIGIEPTFYVTLDRAPRGEAKARGSAAQASFGLNLP
jgi:hypothetical protein